MTHHTQIWPVIHVTTPALALSNARVAFDCGCPGVFVISMHGDDDGSDRVALALKAGHPDKLVGSNRLGYSALASLERSLALGLDATWTDRPGVRSDSISPEGRAIADLLRTVPGHRFFGSIAFKYQPRDYNPGEAAVRAHSMGMIPTTSGEATGVAPPATKLASIRTALGDGAPLALASGVTPENASELAGYLSHILVSTGISKSFDTFDESLLRQLMVNVAPTAQG